MKKPFNIWLIDDHPLILESYELALNRISVNNTMFKFNIQKSNDCDSAIAKIKVDLDKIKVDMVILDISFDKSIKSKFLSGEELGIRIKQLIPDVKIIVSTSHNDSYRINTILRNLNPFGFLIKGDFDSKTLQLAIESIINDTPFYSKTVMTLTRNKNNFKYFLDEIDKQLLYELSIGTKMKYLPNIIPLSKGAIEKRRRRLKDIFEVSKSEDRELILKAKKMGFI